MIWLVLLALGAGAFVTYEFSPKAHAWVDDHMKALRMLWSAIRASQSHVDQAEAATDPSVAAGHAAAADAARREAERQAAIAASTAQTEQQRVAAQQATAALVALGASLKARLAYIFGSGVQPPGDAHDRATEKVTASHGAADVDLKAAKAAPDQATAAAAAADADAANRAAAAHTAAMAAAAKNDAQRAAAARSAAAVEKRSAEIADVFAQLGGVGICGVKTYTGVTAKARDALLAKLHDNGMKVTGNDPWDIEGPLNVKLRAAWDSRSRVLKLIVTAGDKNLCPLIWMKIDPILKEIIGT
jgi:hypothetical protein